MGYSQIDLDLMEEEGAMGLGAVSGSMEDDDGMVLSSALRGAVWC